MKYNLLLKQSYEFLSWTKLCSQLDCGQKLFNIISKIKNKKLIKKSSLLSNMAARIMWSAMPYDMQKNNMLALKSLLPGAKELLKFGTAACLEETSFSLDRTKYFKIQTAYLNNDIETFLNLCYQLFNTKDAWETHFGGSKWAIIAKNLIELHLSIKNTEEAQARGDVDSTISELNNVVVYMNVLDGLVHNTGSLFDKMINIEYKEKNVINEDDYFNEEHLEKREAYKKLVEKLMHAKELEDPANVVKFVDPIIRSFPEKLYPFKDMLSYFRSQSPVENETPIEEQLSLIALKKSIQPEINNIKKYLNDWKNSNNLLDKSSKSIRSSLGYIDAKIKKSKLWESLKQINTDINILLEEYYEYYDEVQFSELNNKNTNIETKNKLIRDTENIISQIEKYFI